MVLFDPEPNNTEHPRKIYARSGWEIPQQSPLVLKQNQQTTGDVRRQTVQIVDDLLLKRKSYLQIRSVSAHLYDCVGMVFANRRAWIDVEHLGQILTEDGYRQVPIEELHAGDVVVYTLDKRRVHVGLVTCVSPRLGSISNIRVLSKWGKVGEVEHGLTDVPYYLGEPTEYWSERVPHDIGELFRGR